MGFGFLLELGGLATALVGFLKTWRDNTEGQSFLSGYPRFHRWVRRTAMAFGWKPNPVSGSGSGVLGNFTGRAYGITYRNLEPGMDADTKAEVAHETAVKALTHASQAHAAVGKEEDARSASDRALEARIAAVEASAAIDLRRFAVEGIPLAVIGLGFAVLGLVGQGIATWATWTA